MINFSKFNSIYSFLNYFHNEATCRQALFEARWMHDGEIDIVCPYCGHHHCRVRKDGRLRCGHCLRNFSVTTGTIFASTKITLMQWFIAMYYISSHKKGISSCQLARDLDVTQATAWYILHKIRTLFKQDSTILLADHKVELDETYIGGAEKNKHASKKTEGTQGRSTKTKAAVFGMRGKDTKKVVAKAVKDSATDSLKPLVEAYLNKKVEVYTDEHNGYNFLDKDDNYAHHIVNHKLGEYSKGGDHTTNVIECFWSHFKKMIDGVYQHVSKKQLQRYIDEAVYRWNTMKMNESDRFNFMFSVCIHKVDYKAIRNYHSNVA